MKLINFSSSVLATLTVALVIFTSVYFCCCAVPVRQFETQAWLKSESPTEVPLDGRINQMIKAAKFDHYLFPVKGVPRTLVFLRATTVAPNDIYLNFVPDGMTDTIIRYRGDRSGGHLYWKVMISE